MSLQNFSLAFQIGASLQSTFSTAFLTAERETRVLADAQALAANQSNSLKRAFQQGIINAQSYANAMRLVTKHSYNYAKADLGTKFAGAAAAYQGMKTAVSAVGGFIQPAIEFEAAMSKVGAIANASGEEMRRLTSTARELFCCETKQNKPLARRKKF